MFGILLNAAILAATLFVVARHEADLALYKVVFLALAVSVAPVLVGFWLPPGWKWVGLVVAFFLCAWGMARFCYLQWGRAFLAAGIYLVLSIAAFIGWSLLTRA